MNQVRTAIVRWAARIVSLAKTPVTSRTAMMPRPLDERQLRQVVGGTDGGQTDSPKGNW